MRLLSFICILLVVSFVSLHGQNTENVDPKKGRVTANPTSGNRYSIEQEIQLGQQAVPEIEKMLTLVPPSDPSSKYLNSLGQKLAAVAPGYKFPYTFKLVREQSINAFALPGGPIYFHTGLIEQASEGEVAGVMGHEIAHVVMRHSTRQASRQTRAQLPLSILGGVLGATVGGWGGSLAQMGISFTAGSVFMKYSRDAETEADMVGTQIMYDAGYNPEAVVSFFKKLEAESGRRGGPQFLNSHPNPGNRAQNVASILERFPPKQFPEQDSPEFVAAKKAIANLPPGSPAGAESGIPSARLSVSDIAGKTYQTFRHSQYSVSYPQNWQVNGDPNATTVTFYPDGGMNGTALSYGVVVSGFTPSPHASTDEAMRQLVATIQQTNRDLQPAGRVEVFTLAGRRAERRDFLGPSAVIENGKPLRERVRLIAVPYRDGEVFYMLFIAPEPDFAALEPTFTHILNSLQAS